MTTSSAAAKIRQTTLPNRVLRLLRSLKAELEVEAGRALTFDELGAYAGEAASTAFDRLHRAEQSQVEGFLRLWERLPEPKRSRLLKGISRSFPSFSDSYLGHDRTQIGWLRVLLHKTGGTTVVRGANPESRTIVVTALARESKGGIQGWNLQPADWFIESPGIRYQTQILTAIGILRWIKENWEATQAPGILLNGVWSCLSTEVQQKILGLGRQHHIILADSFDESFVRKVALPQPVHVVNVVAGGDRILVSVQAC